MSKNYREITHSVSASLAKLRADVPEVTNGFSALARAATKGGALDGKTKELIALAPSASSWKKRWAWRCTWAAAPH